MAQHAHRADSDLVLQIWQANQGQVPFRTGPVARLGSRAWHAVEVGGRSLVLGFT